jgi:hypothetical protein
MSHFTAVTALARRAALRGHHRCAAPAQAPRRLPPSVPGRLRSASRLRSDTLGVLPRGGARQLRSRAFVVQQAHSSLRELRACRSAHRVASPIPASRNGSALRIAAPACARGALSGHLHITPDYAQCRPRAAGRVSLDQASSAPRTAVTVRPSARVISAMSSGRSASLRCTRCAAPAARSPALPAGCAAVPGRALRAGPRLARGRRLRLRPGRGRALARRIFFSGQLCSGSGSVASLRVPTRASLRAKSTAGS